MEIFLSSSLFVILLAVTTLVKNPACSNAELVGKDDFIKNFQELHYEQLHVKNSHTRVKRWIQSRRTNEKLNIKEHNVIPEIKIQFKYGENESVINVTLHQRDTSTFGEYFELEISSTENESPPKVDTIAEILHLFHGVVDGVPNSYVYGSVINGYFEGKIVTGNETLYVERSTRYPHLEIKSHSLIYSGNDVDQRALHQLERNSSKSTAGGCGSEDLNDWMKKFQQSKSQEDMEESSYINYIAHLNHKEPHESLYSFVQHVSVTSRKRRQASSSMKGRTCTLHIRTDPMLWKAIASQMEKDRMDKTAISEEILSLVGQHVKAANEIFKDTLFTNGLTSHRDIQFLVRKVKIDREEDCDPKFTNVTNPFCASHIDVSNFLDIHSRTNYDDFCLSYTFTYRDFADGVVGLAWVASSDLSGGAGGICEKHSGYANFRSKRSLNTGIVTLLNYNRRMPPKVSHLTFTHELGHSFGSSHDPETSECQPGGSAGNFLMYSSATNGYLQNNNKFSPCSIKSIATVLDRLEHGQGKKAKCFKESKATFCGNKIVEENEECDCGYNPVECTDKCCIPRRSADSPSEISQLNPESCKRTQGSSCSPSEGPCCESDCRFSPGSGGSDHQYKLCQPETECAFKSECNGHSPKCPTPQSKPNTELCNNETQVCIDGECRGSICIKYNYEECYLSRENFPYLRAEQLRSTLCKIACFDPLKEKCVPLSEIHQSLNNKTLRFRPGSPCDNFRGYCDAFQRCRAVDEQGPLSRLTKILFDTGTYRNVIDWIEKNPIWSVMIGCIFIVLFGLFVKCCAVHTPSSNPMLPHHLKITDTLQKPIQTLRRRPKGRAAGPESYQLGAPPKRGRGRRNHGATAPLPSERASMIPFH